MITVEEELVNGAIIAARNAALERVTHNNAPWLIRALVVLRYAKWQINSTHATEWELKGVISEVVGEPHASSYWAQLFFDAERQGLIRTTCGTKNAMFRAISKLYELL